MKRFLFYISIGCVALTILVVATTMIINDRTKSYLYEGISDAPVAQAAVIPGAAILSNGALSSIFKDRVDSAIQLYKANKVSKILVSGDNSTVSHNEVNPVRNYLLENAITDTDIFLDHAGFDTYSTMYRARDIFGVTSIIITTKSFHLPRAVFIARKLRIEAYGVRTDRGRILFRNYVREVFADAKAVLDLMTARIPKYLGKGIPITGDGRKSQ